MATRREFIGTVAAAALPAVAFAADEAPALGLIFPPLNYPIPPDAQRLYTSRVRFLGDGVGLPGGMTPEGYDEAIPRVIPAALRLKAAGARVISVFGSSLTFYKGAKFHQDLIDKVRGATGVLATTQSSGLIDGLHVANARRVAVATAYTDVVTNRLKAFLEEYGFQATAAKGLGYERIPEDGVTQATLLQLGLDAYAQSKKADALVVSCGALKTLDLIVPLEQKIGVPVVSSTPHHGLMNGVRLLGVTPRVQGFGMVFSRA